MQATQLLSLLLSLLFLPGCAHTAVDPGPSAPPELTQQETPGPAEEETPTYLTCRIADGADAGDLLLAGEDGEVYALPASALPNAPALQDGMTVTVAHSGLVLETWPAQFGEVYSLTVADEETDDRCGLYLQVLEDLWNTDPGLNSDDGLTYLGMDLSGLTHLTEAERAAVSWRFAQTHGLTLVEGTWEELCEVGYIDREHLEWRDGILFTLTTDEDAVWSLPMLREGEDPPALTAFDAQKWRSGLGAYIFADCSAQRGENGVWTYTVAAEAIA